jgi:hypothetical protein
MSYETPFYKTAAVRLTCLLSQRRRDISRTFPYGRKKLRQKQNTGFLLFIETTGKTAFSESPDTSILNTYPGIRVGRLLRPSFLFSPANCVHILPLHIALHMI